MLMNVSWMLFLIFFRKSHNSPILNDGGQAHPKLCFCSQQSWKVMKLAPEHSEQDLKRGLWCLVQLEKTLWERSFHINAGLFAQCWLICSRSWSGSRLVVWSDCSLNIHPKLGRPSQFDSFQRWMHRVLKRFKTTDHFNLDMSGDDSDLWKLPRRFSTLDHETTSVMISSSDDRAMTLGQDRWKNETSWNHVDIDLIIIKRKPHQDELCRTCSSSVTTVSR